MSKTDAKYDLLSLSFSYAYMSEEWCLPVSFIIEKQCCYILSVLVLRSVKDHIIDLDYVKILGIFEGF